MGANSYFSPEHQDLLAGLEEQECRDVVELFARMETAARERLFGNEEVCNAVRGLPPDLRGHALRFLAHDGAVDLFNPEGYPAFPTIEKAASYLRHGGVSALPSPRMVRKLRFLLIKHGTLNMRGFIERFDFSHLMRAFTTRVLHTLTLAEKLSFNIPICIDPEASTSPWSDAFRDRFGRCWLLSYIDSPQRARPSPEAMDISARFNRFTDLNYRALYYLNVHDKTVGSCLNCLQALEEMLRCYLDLFEGTDTSELLDLLAARSIEAEIFAHTRNQIEASLRQELELKEQDDLPLDDALPPHTEAILMAYDGEKASRHIQTQDLRTLELAERSRVSVAELINILHQRGLVRGPELFDKLRQAGGRVITEISTSRKSELADSPPRTHRTNDFITFIDLRQSRQGGSLPFPVRVIVDAVTRNANIIPDTSRLKLIIYASELETHLDIKIGGHSARVHYSLAPPERGGRFALQYAEGSNEEGNLRRLEVMARAFRKAGLKVAVNGQFLEAVYDKDCGATALDAVREKAALGLQILNSMPDLDYALGGFNGSHGDQRHVELFGFFDPPAIEQILEAWSQHCFENGFFFLDLLRPAKAIEDQFYSHSELYWNGRGPYCDPYRQLLQKYASLLDEALRESLGRTNMPLWDEAHTGSQAPGQTLFDRIIDSENRALRHSLLVIDERGFARAHVSIGEIRQHPVPLFLDFLQTDEPLPVLTQTALLAEQVTNLGSWEDLGKLGGLWVSRLRISIIKDVLSFFALREPASPRILLAFATIGEDPLPTPFIDRVAERVRPSNVITEPDWIALVLSLFGYRTEEVSKAPPRKWSLLAELLQQPNPPDIDIGMASIPGIIASPGIITARLRANTPDRPLSDYEDGILVDDFLSPSDDPKIQTCRGVLITSGGELSHAAIRTREFQKPSLILKDIRYRNGTLTYVPHYNRCFMSCRSIPLRSSTVIACYCPPGNREPIKARDGDLLRLDADRGQLVLLGNEPDMQQAFQVAYTLERHPEMESLWREMARQMGTVERAETLFFRSPRAFEPFSTPPAPTPSMAKRSRNTCAASSRIWPGARTLSSKSRGSRLSAAAPSWSSSTTSGPPSFTASDWKTWRASLRKPP